ncbi:MAG: hypothetical protein [Bacteriophage sp.]|nr:MAG: hypothetical protein [Bacteriophage sp.]
MVRTKIEKFIYSVIDRNTKQVIGFFESTVELKSQKAKVNALISAGYAEDSVCVLTDTESARYEMSDEQFFAEANRMPDEQCFAEAKRMD